MDTKKGFTTFAVGVFVIAVVVAIYFIYIRLTHTQSQPTSDNTSDQVADQSIYEDWLTYTSDKHGYQFKYPSEAKLNSDPGVYAAVSYMGQKQIDSGRVQTELFDGYSFSVVDVTDEGFDNLDDFSQSRIEQQKQVCNYVGQAKEVQVDGRDAITLEVDCLGSFDVYYLQDGDTFFEIGLLHVGDEEDLPGYVQTSKQILSSLKFK